MLWILSLLPILTAPGLFLLARRARTDGDVDESVLRRTLAFGSLTILGATAWAAVTAVLQGWTGRLVWSDTITLHLGLEPFSSVLAVLVPLVAAAVVLYAAFHEGRPGLRRLVVLLTAFVGGMELLVCAADLLTLIVGWELVGALSWALIAHHWREGHNPRQANAAFVVTRAGDLGLFVAAGLTFAHTGAFTYDALASLDGTILSLAAAGLVVAAAAKSAQVPFAPWLFSAMAGPPSVSALLHSATMVAAGAFLLIRLHPTLDAVPWFAPAVVTLGLVTALCGSLVALLQTHSKKLLAASTSAHYGLMFVAVGAGYPAVAMLHLAAHAFFKAPKFLTTGIAKEHTGDYDLRGPGLGPAMPWVAAAAGVCALALGGVPPLGGAWTKEEVLTAAGHHATTAAVLIAVVGALSAAYAARFWFQVFGVSGPQEDRPGPSTAERGAVGSLALGTLVLSVLWIPAVNRFLGTLLGGEIPHPKTWETALSLTLVTVGVALGWAIATYRPGLGSSPTASAVGSWLGLPRLAHRTLARPALALARTLAAFDDRVMDAPARGAEALTDRLSGRLARDDLRVVDAGVRGAAAFTDRLADASSRIGERVVDRLPEGLSALVGRSGSRARRLQTGLAHHYYTWIVLGSALGLALLFFFSGV